MQVAFYLAGEITQVKESIPWVRCASGNVYLMNLGDAPSLNIWVVKNLLQHLEISNVHLQGLQLQFYLFYSIHQFNVEGPDAKQSSSVVTLVQTPKSIHWVSDSISDSDKTLFTIYIPTQLMCLINGKPAIFLVKTYPVRR